MLTVIGDDRAGLVNALADVVSAHDGNWEDSQLAELAGKFAGIVVVGVSADRSDALVSALHELDGLLEVSVHTGSEERRAQAGSRALTVDLIGNDSPGIVREVSAVLSRHGLSIETMETQTRDAPMAGGRLFEAHVEMQVPPSSDLTALRADLEKLAAELMVEVTLAPPQTA